ncbi:SCO family protein [Desulfopila sp. IMCC35008]|uniref:SCO family protein n=1 Tax=Desulfopila sp. IMCC35008 TaxID=2653858 RepID=UPI0013D3D85E|nr:SCO family protein [Desulfopila sp. IMCC35008]
MRRLQLIFHLLLFVTVATSAVADDPVITEQQAATGVVEKTGEFIPLDVVFRDSEGSSTTLRAIIDKPTLLLPVYYTCPQICSFDMANLALALQQTSIPHDSFNIITLSFNEEEAPRHASAAKRSYTAMLAEDFPTDNWHFLVGEKENILMVTEAIGYTFKAAEDGLFLHPSALVATGSDGKIIKYVYGSFLSGDVDLALSEAAKGTPATSIKRFLAYCLSGEVQQNKTVFLILKSSVIVLVIIGGVFLVRLLRREE